MARTENKRGHRQQSMAKPKPTGALTISEIAKDKLTQLAEQHWSAAALAREDAPEFSPALVDEIYGAELAGSRDEPPALRRVQLLEVSQYLENYLWPNFPAEDAPRQHVMSILVMINEKFREGVPAWACFRETQPEKFPAFFKAYTALRTQLAEMRMHERVAYMLFTIRAFQSLEEEMVRAQVLKLVSLPLWHSLSPGRLQLELHDNPALLKHWRHAARREAKAAAADPSHVPVRERAESRFLPDLVDEFLRVLDEVGATASAPASGRLPRGALLFLERGVELFTDLLAQLPTRRFVHALLDDRAFLVKCTRSALGEGVGGAQGVLFRQLLDLLRFYSGFAIADHTGDALTDDDVISLHYEKLQALQRLLFKHVPELRDLALASCAEVQRRDVLTKALRGLPADRLRRLVARQLRLVSEDDPQAGDPGFLVEVAVTAYEARRSQAAALGRLPLYPTESVLFDEHRLPGTDYSGDRVLALPKLNLQFLTVPDYLIRNFNLFRLEATYEIREDIADVLGRVRPFLLDNDEVGYAGWSKMACKVERFGISEVRAARVGEARPAAVTAELVIDLAGMREDVRREWEELKQHDVVLLLGLQPPDAIAQQAAKGGGAPGSDESSVARQYGLTCVRGCEIVEVRDEGGQLLNDFSGRTRPDQVGPRKGTLRTLSVALDPAQYQLDADAGAAERVYAGFDLVMRRQAKENNFKAVLESIRDLLATDSAVPAWLQDVLLGYGDPAAAQYTALPGQLHTVDFKDTFLDADHLREAFPAYEVEFTSSRADKLVCRPFRITFPEFGGDGGVGAQEKGGDAGTAAPPSAPPSDGATRQTASAGSKRRRPVIRAEAYTAVDPGPYPEDEPPQNGVRFTSVQTDAILSGVQPGLTLVVGPPGTGKTDTAVQILHLLYHNRPGERTLLITHSNQALNDLFAKVVQRDVPARYLLRLGMGEAELDTEEVFSRVGRVNAMLARRLDLLAQVERLAGSLGVAAPGSAYTCETAAHFWLMHVLARWERFASAVKAAAADDTGAVARLFPFAEFFSDAPGQLFGGEDAAADMERARGCFRHLRRVFQELEETRPFELLRTQADRIDYLLTKQAKIVAMTCTHAALKRREFLEMGFKYDNLVMEESAQILEIETFIPMLLQKPEDGVNRLKRVIMIGDHHQLPPVVKNMALQKYSNLDQSLFTRFIRMGTPYIELNAQGRARPELAALYNWRYRDLGDLPHVAALPAFQAANPGFVYDYQLVDVPDYQGRGETCPMPYFYQNLGEAEYLVSVYQYMRLLGYPASQIAVLTTYNGQAALLRDVFARRCAQHPAFGMPSKISTVDKFQGQQAEYVLLSLVRTTAFGHLRDVRRLVVALSRARLGLYIFARAGLFGQCHELRPAFQRLLARPTALTLAPSERFGGPEPRAAGAPPAAGAVAVQDGTAMAMLVANMVTQWETAATAVAAGSGTAWQPAPPPGSPPRPVPEAMDVDGADGTTGAAGDGAMDAEEGTEGVDGTREEEPAVQPDAE